MHDLILRPTLHTRTFDGYWRRRVRQMAAGRPKGSQPNAPGSDLPEHLFERRPWA
jgi:hypothetical protein